jgi:plasmid stabilization system protein ParE
MFLVVWSDVAFDDMSRIVRAHPTRKREFATALRQIAHRLATDPERVGESRDGGVRVMFAGEVSVFYRVDHSAQTVEIGNVRLRKS